MSNHFFKQSRHKLQCPHGTSAILSVLRWLQSLHSKLPFASDTLDLVTLGLWECVSAVATLCARACECGLYVNAESTSRCATRTSSANARLRASPGSAGRAASAARRRRATCSFCCARIARASSNEDIPEHRAAFICPVAEVSRTPGRCS